jgi:hypothetical protein
LGRQVPALTWAGPMTRSPGVRVAGLCAVGRGVCSPDLSEDFLGLLVVIRPPSSDLQKIRALYLKVITARMPERVTAVLLKQTVFPEPPSRYRVTVTIRDGRRFLTQSPLQLAPGQPASRRAAGIVSAHTAGKIISMVTVYARTDRQ